MMEFEITRAGAPESAAEPAKMECKPVAEETIAKPERTLKPLAHLFPYILRYKALAGGALTFLLLAAVTTLILPTAVRRMIDHGFTHSDINFINT